MDFRRNEIAVEVIKKGAFAELISDIFILILMISFIKTHLKHLMC